jgi:translocation and assembly module TamB
MVTFSSAPPLSSEQILLMLTAGEVPNDEYVFSTQAKVGQLATFVGRDLLSRWQGDPGSEERLVIRSGEVVSEEGKTTYSAEYRLSDRWSLVAEYDRFGALNASVKWRIIAR